MAVLAVVFATHYPGHSSAVTPAELPGFVFSGLTGLPNQQGQGVLRPGSSQQTRQSIQALTARSDISTVRATSGVSPIAAFSSGVTAAAALSGEADAGIKPLADIIDPREPFALWVAGPGNSVSELADRFGVSVTTILQNNPEISDRDLLRLGQQIVVPRRDGILYKVTHGETVASIVDQYDNVTVDEVIAYRPNAIADPNSLETGRHLLLPNATIKPPPPPPPPPPAPSVPGGPPPPRGDGRFSMPLGAYRAVTDRFGTGRGGGTYHTGIDLGLWGLEGSPIYAACDGVVTRTEFLTYSYGYHVIIDCGEGWSTLYAHMSRIDVVPGQRTAAGTVLGLSGSTGYSTGEHLHFEIRYRGAPVNPNDYLPFY